MGILIYYYYYYLLYMNKNFIWNKEVENFQLSATKLAALL